MNSAIAITVCSINNLAHAKGLADSVVKHNPDYQVVIGLVDKLAKDFDVSEYSSHLLVEVEELKLPFFKDMCDRYNLHELNCALKSFFVRWALDKFKPPHVIYLDGDMLVFDSFDPLKEMLDQYSVLITPHITKPFPDDGFRPRENDILKTGMYNAGFFAVKNDETGNSLIDWWKDRMVDQGYERPKDGYNSDQNWLNFVPLYFRDVGIVRHPGCNAAYWNLHERRLDEKNGRFVSNDQPLIFYHYSGYAPNEPGKISKHQDRFSMQDNPAIAKLFRIYHETLMKNGFESLKNITPFYKKRSSGGRWKIWGKKV